MHLLFVEIEVVVVEVKECGKEKTLTWLLFCVWFDWPMEMEVYFCWFILLLFNFLPSMFETLFGYSGQKNV